MACCEPSALCTGALCTGSPPEVCVGDFAEEGQVERTESATELRELNKGEQPDDPAPREHPDDLAPQEDLRPRTYRKFVRPGPKSVVTKDFRPREGFSLGPEPDMCGLSCLGWSCGVTSFGFGANFANFDAAVETLESSSGLANARRLPEPSYASTSLIATCTHPCAPYEDEYQSESEDELAYARDVPSGEPSLSVADLRLSAYGS